MVTDSRGARKSTQRRRGEGKPRRFSLRPRSQHTSGLTHVSVCVLIWPS